MTTVTRGWFRRWAGVRGLLARAVVSTLVLPVCVAIATPGAAHADGPTVHAFAGLRARSGVATQIGQFPTRIAYGGGFVVALDHTRDVVLRLNPSTGQENVVYGDGLPAPQDPTASRDPLKTALSPDWTQITADSQGDAIILLTLLNELVTVD